MTANAAEFAGPGCGRRYEKELETHFRDCLLFYLDGRMLWEKEPEFDTDQKALPRRLTDVQENGDALQFDSARKRYVKTEEFDTDKMNGYSRFKVFLLRQRTKTR